MARRSNASSARVLRGRPSPERRHNAMTSVATSTSRSLNVRTSDVRSRCNRNRQPRASDAHPYTAVCTRRCRLTMQSESQTSCTLPLVLHEPMHTVRQQPARKEQQLATDVHADAGGSVHNTPPRRLNDSCTDSSLNRTTSVRTTRACRRTSLCNSRVHSFPQLPEHQTGTSVQELRHHGCTRRIKGGARERHNCSVVFEAKRSDVWGNQTARY